MAGTAIVRRKIELKTARPLPHRANVGKTSVWDLRWGVPLEVKDPSKSRLRVVVTKALNRAKECANGVSKAFQSKPFPKRELLTEGPQGTSSQ